MSSVPFLPRPWIATSRPVHHLYLPSLLLSLSSTFAFFSVTNICPRGRSRSVGKGLLPQSWNRDFVPLGCGLCGRDTLLPSPPGLAARSAGTDSPTCWKSQDQLRTHLQARSNGKWHTCLPENKALLPGACPPRLVTGHPSASLATALPTSWQVLLRLLIGSCFWGSRLRRCIHLPGSGCHPRALCSACSSGREPQSYPVSLHLSRLTYQGLRGQRELSCPPGTFPGESLAKARDLLLSFIQQTCIEHLL